MTIGLCVPVSCKPAGPTDTDEADTDTDADADTDADTDADADTDTAIVPTCPDDPAEPNDSVATAVPSEGGVGLVVCATSADYWSVTVAAGEQIDVRVQFDGSLNDIDVKLRSSTGSVLDTSETTSDEENVSWFNDTGAEATVVVHVYMFTPGGVNEYDFTVARTACTDDTSEPNDDLAGATPITSLADRVLIATNEDWYAFTVSDQELLTVEVPHDASMGDLDLQLVDADGTVLASATTGADTEAVAYFNDSGADATIALRVFFWAGSAAPCNTYDVVSERTPLVCTEDPLEPNDVLADRQNVFGVTGLTIDAGDVDHLTIDVAAGAVVEVSVLADPAVLVPSLELLQTNGAWLADGNPLTWANAGTDIVQVVAVVEAEQGVCGPYELSVVDRTPDCAVDAHEDDDDFANARAAADGAYTLFPGDPDWFAVDVAPGTVAAAVLEWDGLYGSAVLRAYDGSGPFAVDASNSPASVRLPGGSGAPASYAVAVEDPADVAVCLPYQLSFVHQDCGVNDALEPNDSLSTALPATSGDYLVDDAELDYLALGSVAPGQQISASITFLHALGDLDLRLLDTNGVQLDGSATVDDVEQVAFTNSGSVARDVVLEVRQFGVSTGCSTPYTLTSSVGVP
ncbi:MAG: hypothetical protein R3F61_19245 [Myxococcota bacterium]